MGVAGGVLFSPQSRSFNSAKRGSNNVVIDSWSLGVLNGRKSAPCETSSELSYRLDLNFELSCDFGIAFAFSRQQNDTSPSALLRGKLAIARFTL
jgi:hypothetical protein